MTDAAGPADLPSALVPQLVRNELLHGYVQLLADRHRVRVLHLKGNALDPTLRDGPRHSADADILVAPADVSRFAQLLRQGGWTPMSGFAEGSAFGHAMNLWHSLGTIDLHRQWPGFEVDPADAFETLWGTRGTTTLAHVVCPVPGLAGQRLVLATHYARSQPPNSADLDLAWSGAGPAQRREVEQLARQLRAEVALAAATGDLHRYRSRPSYRLWQYFATGSVSRLEEWRGRWNIAPGVIGKAGVARRFLTVNADQLKFELGREPGPVDYARAAARRTRHALADVRIVARRARGARRAPGDRQ